jgi:hypothetical protein
MNDWGVAIPLWVGQGQLLLDVAELGISRALEQKLLDWQAAFAREFSMETGWSSDEARKQHAVEADGLLQDLRLALPQTAVTVDLWCVEGRTPRW